MIDQSIGARLRCAVWRLTGWIPPNWYGKDIDAKLRYWYALNSIARGEPDPQRIAWEALLWRE